MEKINELRIHESVNIKPNCWAMRVPGGLVYQYKNGNGNVLSTAFVPYIAFKYD